MTLESTTKICIVTGGTLGIGAAIASHLANSGHIVYTCSRHKNEIPGINHKIINLTNSLLSAEWVNEIIKIEGRIDWVINNAAIYQIKSMINRNPTDIIEEISTNFTSPVVITTESIKQMAIQKYGVILNIASQIVFKKNISNRSLYSASKAGLIEFTRGLSQEHSGSGIKILAMCPGLVSTRMNKSAIKTPEEIVPEIMSLLTGSETNGFFSNGQKLNW